MENKENLVPEGAENTEAAAEATAEQIETPAKTYTEDEVNQIVGRKRAIDRAKIQKNNDRTYGELMNVLRAGTGKESVEDITETFKQFYTKNGVNIPSRNAEQMTARDLETLARADAEDIIRGGYEEVVEEMDRLTEIGAERMTAREKAVFKALAANRESAERAQELDRIGASQEVYNSQEFKDFAKQFRDDVPVAKIYETYTKTQPKQEYKTMGSVKNSTATTGSEIKDFYSFEEASKYSRKDLEKNPALYEAIKKSMLKW